MSKKWIPLEANPEVLNAFAQKLGLDTAKLAFCDIYSLDEVSWTPINAKWILLHLWV